MSERKLRVLWVGESSYLLTGYAIYARELLSRLYDSGKYELAEFGCYGRIDDPRIANIRWRYYSNLPANEAETQAFNQNQLFQFGSWKFEEVVLEFKPDVVLAIRDPWMDQFLHDSPLRPYYSLIIMPTVDSAPQMEQWIQTYITADNVFAYSEFGYEVLEKESGGKIKLCGVASPGVNFDNLHPLPNRNELRQKIGIEDDAIVVGTVNRNQKRKLYPDLIQAFRTFSDKYPGKSYLYMHTSFPDLGWDIPRLIREAGIGTKTLMTYICAKCGNVIPQFFSDARAFCPQCHQMSAMLPNTQHGVADADMKYIFNLMDVYVQYAICEGLGIGQIEAAACGVPIMSVDYSAMASVVRNVHGYPIKVQRFFRESETHAFRAYPDNDDLVEKLLSFARMPSSMRLKKSRETLLACRKIYNWDRIAKLWEDAIDKTQPRNQWASPPKVFQPKTELPGRMDNPTIVRWGIINVLGQPELLNSYFELRMVRDLNYGARLRGFGGMFYNEDSTFSMQRQYENFSQEDALNDMLSTRNNMNYWEMRRTGQAPQRLMLNVKPDLQEIKL